MMTRRMIPIRTGLVALAFVAMGLTSAVEYLADTLSDRNGAATVGADIAAPAKVLRLTQKAPSRKVDPAPAPWI